MDHHIGVSTKPSSLLHRKNRRIRKLKEKIKKFKVLDHYVKSGNKTMKNQVTLLSEEYNKLKREVKNFRKRAKYCARCNRKLCRHNKALKIKLLM